MLTTVEPVRGEKDVEVYNSTTHDDNIQTFVTYWKACTKEITHHELSLYRLDFKPRRKFFSQPTRKPASQPISLRAIKPSSVKPIVFSPCPSHKIRKIRGRYLFVSHLSRFSSCNLKSSWPPCFFTGILFSLSKFS